MAKAEYMAVIEKFPYELTHIGGGGDPVAVQEIVDNWIARNPLKKYDRGLVLKVMAAVESPMTFTATVTESGYQWNRHVPGSTLPTTPYVVTNANGALFGGGVVTEEDEGGDWEESVDSQLAADGWTRVSDWLAGVCTVVPTLEA